MCYDTIEKRKWHTGENREWIAELQEPKGISEARDDYTTYDILKKYYQDEEEDMYWGEAQLELIECIGKQNWILRQL